MTAATSNNETNYGSVGGANASASAATNGTAESESTPLLSKPNVTQQQQQQSTPYSHYSLWSRLTFGWFSPILDLGNAQPQLNPNDLGLVPLPPNCSTNDVQTKFQREWNKQLSSNKPSLSLALFHAFGAEFLKAGFLKLVHDLSIFVGPQVLNGLIQFLRDADAPLSQGLWLTLVVTFSQLLMSFCLRHYFFQCFQTGLQLRSAVVTTVYQKALKLASFERQSKSLGEITNLLSTDAQRMQDLTTYLHAIWYSFIQIGLALYFLWLQLGASSLGGVAVMVTMMPITKFLATWLGGIQKRLMAAKDKRVNLNSELIASIKVIKLQAWETSLEEKLLALREAELRNLWHYICGQALSIMLWGTTPLAVALATFATYVVSGHTLDVATALTSLALFDILRFPLFMLPQVINRIVEAHVSTTRIQSFLQCAEHTGVQSSNSGSKDDGDDAPTLEGFSISMHNATYCYESRKPKAADGVEPDDTLKQLLDQQWEIQLLKSQLADAERNLRGVGTNNSKEKDALQSTEHSSDYSGTAPDLLALKRVDFECRPGELVAVIGGVGCGKSTFVNAILGELRQLSGETYLNGDIAYFSQTPFILNDTIRNNILFGHSADEIIDEDLYQDCLKSCALTHDLTLLPAGDMTEVGEKGITISGGQKARVALARAMYHNADITILDDPLAAVDAHVAKQLMEDAILRKLRNELHRTVVLVTNALQYLHYVDRILVFQNGRIVEQGTFQELSANSTSILSNFLTILGETGVSPTTTEGCDTAGLSIDDNDEDEKVIVSIDALEDSTHDDKAMGAVVAQLNPTESLELDRDSDDNDDDNEDEPNDDKKAATSGALMTSEFQERVTGKVETRVYVEWGRAAGGIWIPFAIVVVYGMVEVVNITSKWWLTYWSAHGDERSQMSFLAVYAVINLTAVVCTFLRLMLLMSCALRASRKIFARLLQVVLKAPMSFFDTTPTGRIINRFSSDMETLDVQLVSTLRSYLTTLFTIVSTIVVISTITPVFTLCLIPILAFYLMQQAYFTTTYRELKRLDSIGRSPIYALLGETLDGVATIRAFGASQTLSDRLHAMLDRQQHAYFLITAAQCWLAIRLELAGTMIITFACLASVLQHGSRGGDETFAGLAGLGISYALTVTQSLNWSVRMASDFEANMVALERIEQYCNIPSEADRETDTDAEAGPKWPERGEITFIGAKLQYRKSLPLVLKGLDIHIPAGKKVGIVGRTGAGKSTLMVALLRIVELCEGQILIDGVDHSKLGLAKLRSKIAVIPQDPVLFSGTVRTNLDPFEEFADERLLDVLSRVGLYSTISRSRESSTTSLSSLGGQIHSLYDTVADSGSNYSVGQRQLLVIARALLCGSNIVIMDEATAAVDADTDARIQKVMRSDFEHATCLTVAHRINTIVDSDYIMVMSDGKAAEFDTPQNLMRNGGLFRGLVEAASREGE